MALTHPSWTTAERRVRGRAGRGEAEAGRGEAEAGRGRGDHSPQRVDTASVRVRAWGGRQVGGG